MDQTQPTLPRAGWREYLSAAVRTAGKCIPGVSHAIDIVEHVENRRTFELHHHSTLQEISRIEAGIADVVEREMKTVLDKRHTTVMNGAELEKEVRSLREMRAYGREPYLCQGLLANSIWYDELKARPNVYGRILGDHDIPAKDAFYVFVDAEKSRLLELSPFALQQLLAGQAKGTPAAAAIVGQQDLFAQRRRPTDLQTVVAPSPSTTPTQPKSSTTLTHSPSRLAGQGGLSIGDRVQHDSSAGSFGSGVIVGFGKQNVLVEWDAHSVVRRTRDLTSTQSHVAPRNLSRI